MAFTYIKCENRRSPSVDVVVNRGFDSRLRLSNPGFYEGLKSQPSQPFRPKNGKSSFFEETATCVG